MTILAQKTRLGRYIFATGGNPEAASLAAHLGLGNGQSGVGATGQGRP